MSLVYSRLQTGRVLLMRNRNTVTGPVFMTVPLKEGSDPDSALSKILRGDYSMVDFNQEQDSSFVLTDEDVEFLNWGPSGDGDNWCEHFKVTGSIQLSEKITEENLDMSAFEPNYAGVPGYYRSYVNSSFYGRLDPNWSESRGWINKYLMSSFSINYVEGVHIYGSNERDRQYVIQRRLYGFTYEQEYWYYGKQHYNIVYSLTGQDFVVANLSQTGGYSTLFLRDAYNSLRNHALWILTHTEFRGDMEFEAAQNAALSYRAYDVNLVEAAFDLAGGLDSQLPGTVADSITTALTHSVYQNLPSKVLDVARAMGNAYLYQKYVVQPTVSDVMELTGAEALHVLDESDTNEYTDIALQTLAEQLVYKGSKEVSRYGTASETLHDGALGDITCHTNVRVRAYPRYLKDMSDAAIIVENIGLALSAERLTEVIPYEFVANWFLPIEDSVRAIEYNDARLNSMWEITGICTSRTIECGIGNLLALHGLSAFSGQLNFTFYTRGWSNKFPSTRLPAVGPSRINVSRTLQGAALIINS